MPNIGDYVFGRDIGSSQKTTRFVWIACPDCGKERWVRYITKQNKTASVYCLSCAHKRIQEEIRVGIRPKPVITRESHRIRSESKRGANNPNYKKYGSLNPAWRGGRHNSDGYIRVWVHPDDFFARMAAKDGTVAEHRLVMAKHLGRCLLPWEVVHHINNNRSDNRIKNLRLLNDRKYHMIDTQTKRYIRSLENQIKKLKSKLAER